MSAPGKIEVYDTTLRDGTQGEGVSFSISGKLRLAAGLDGIENGFPLPPEVTGNVFDLTDEERAAERVGRLPGTLAEALDAMESSELVAAALGEHLFAWFLRNKRREWDRYQRHVSRLELREYLPIL